jgi:hypothetical protein
VLRVNGLELEGIAYAYELIGGGGGQAEADVKIQLLVRGEFAGSAQMEEMLRASALGEVAGVFDEGVALRGELSVEQETGLTGQIARRSLSGPEKCEHAGGGPIFGDGVRPGQQQLRIVTVTGHGVRS